jgi:predicted dienelactone hydrolase
MRFLFCCAIAVLLAACASAPSERPHNEAAAKQFADHGYIAEQRFEIVKKREPWSFGETTFDVEWALPATGGPWPLVLYLPGLGERVEAGSRWRDYWARAGYAVVAVQPAEIGERIWGSPRARAGEFDLIAKEEFSGPHLQQRLDWLRMAHERIERKRSAREDGFDRIDTGRVAVVGFDLGAQTAMIQAGEQVTGLELPPPPKSVRGVIAFSPYADLSRSAFEARYGAIASPVLSITGSGDADPYGLVSSVALRRTPYTYMPAGEKYLLELPGASHSQLGGADATEPAREHTGGGRSSGMGGSRRRGGGGSGGGASSGGSQPPEGPSDTAAARAVPLGREVGRDPAAAAKRAVAIQQVSTAFLDAALKDDSVAREWLRKDAQRWLGGTGQLSAK